MSMDNGIYVLYTDSQKGPVYRVSYAHAIGNIYGTFDEQSCKYPGNPELIREVFGKSQCFHTLNEALDFAEELKQNHDYLEDGICVIYEFKEYGYLFE